MRRWLRSTATAAATLCGLAAAVCQLGCASPDDVEETAPPFDHPAPTPYDPVGGDDLTASLTPDELAAVTPEVLTATTDLNPNQIFAIYNDLFALSDANCPEAVTTTATGAYWSGNCTTAGGAQFQGAVRIEYSVDEPEGDALVNGFIFSTEGQVLTIVAPDGRSLRASMYMGARATTYPANADQKVYSMSFQGDVQTDAATAGDNRWLSGQARGTVYRYAAQDEYGRYYSFGGSLAMSEGPLVDAGVTAISFDELALVNYGCVGMQGGVHVRDSSGGWHYATFAPKQDATPDEICNTCGDLSFQQQQLGAFCSDSTSVESLVSWGDTPW